MDDATRLTLCRCCRRHVRRAETICPFCAAAVGAVAALALFTAGCHDGSRGDEPSVDASTASPSTDASVDLDAERQDLLDRLEAGRAPAVYGAPRPQRRVDASACTCAPGDPLCSCF